MIQAPDKSKAGNNYEEVKEHGKDILENISDTFKEKSTQAKETVEETKDKVTEYVRECPYRALLIATLIGTAFGLLIKR